MEKMRQGNMDIDIEYKAEDELGKLSDDLRSVAAFLNAVVADETNILTEMSRGNFNVYSSMSKDYVGSFVASITHGSSRDNLTVRFRSVTQSADRRQQVPIGYPRNTGIIPGCYRAGFFRGRTGSYH